MLHRPLVCTTKSERSASRLERPVWRQAISLGLGGSGSGEGVKYRNDLGADRKKSASCTASALDATECTAMVGNMQTARQEPAVVSSSRPGLQSSQLIMSGDMAIFSIMPFA